MRTNWPLCQYVAATKSASWTECASSFDDTNIAVILPNNQNFSGNEHVLSSLLEIDELCNQVIAIFMSFYIHIHIYIYYIYIYYIYCKMAMWSLQ